MSDVIVPKRSLCAGARLFVPGESRPSFHDNTILFDWASIQVKLLQGLPEYKISALYFEYENLSSPSDDAAVPSYDRTGGVDYYQGLDDHPSRDFLRVFLSSAQESNSNSASFSLADKLTLFALTSGTEGVHGKDFSAGANSKVFGLAVVATPSVDDPTQDIVYGRWYSPLDQQQLKTASKQIGGEYYVQFI